MELLTTRNVGASKEQKACDYLKNHGLKLVEKNFNTRGGEIDLIMRDQDELVFVEVRFRQHKGYGSGLESIHSQKQKKILRTALIYLMKHNKVDTEPCRFDVVSIDNENNIEWIKQAFTEA